MKKRLLALGIIFISGCATQGSTSLGESNGQVVLADSYIGEAYETVISRAKLKFSAEPVCTQRKVSLSKQRKAFQYEVCDFTPDKQRYLDSPLDQVAYHFITGELVRVDVRIGDDSESDSDAKDNAGPVQLRLVDHTMVQSAPWLASE